MRDEITARHDRCSPPGMDHVTYGLFDERRHALRARDALLALPVGAHHRCRVLVEHGRLDEGLLGILETGATQGLRRGALLGGLLGAVLGVFAADAIGGPFGAVGLALLLATQGGLWGALTAAGSNERTLEELRPQIAKGKTLLIVEAPTLAVLEEVDATLFRHAGLVRHKAPL